MRILAFRSFATHAWLKKDFAKLSKKELQMCESFIIALGSISHDEFAVAVNRWFLDDPNKPKRHTIMWGLVSTSGSAVREQERNNCALVKEYRLPKTDE